MGDENVVKIFLSGGQISENIVSSACWNINYVSSSISMPLWLVGMMKTKDTTTSEPAPERH